MGRVLYISLVTMAALVLLVLAFTYPRYSREMSPIKERLASSAGVANLPHGELEYTVVGEGVPVLTLHGAGGGWDQGVWTGHLVFGDTHRLIGVSRFGYLRTPIPANASIKLQAALYRDLLNQLNIPKVIVLGLSAGGPSATQFANDYPERTSALILLSAVGQPSAQGDQAPFYVNLIYLIQRSDYAYWLVARFFQPSILNLLGIPAGVYARFTPEEKQLAQEMLDTMHPMSRRYAGTRNDGAMLQRQPPSTEHIEAPTLILHATDDALVSFEHARHAHAAIADSRLVLFPSGGHGLLPQMQEVRKNVREFLGEP